jgi:hypothetical protein
MSQLAFHILELSLCGPGGMTASAVSDAEFDKALREAEVAAVECLPADNPTRQAILETVERLRHARARAAVDDETRLEEMGDRVMRQIADDDAFLREVSRLTAGLV